MNTLVSEREARPSSQASPKDEKHREPAPKAAQMQNNPDQTAPGADRAFQSPLDCHPRCLDLAAEFLARG